MSRTSGRVTINFIPTISIYSSCNATNNNNEIGNIKTLVTQMLSTIQNDNFATLEHNIFLLDGTYSIAEPSEHPYGYFGTELSGDDCKVTNSNVKIILTKPNNVTYETIDMAGITIYTDSISNIEYTIEGNTYQKKIINLTKEKSQIVFNDPKNIMYIDIDVRETRFPHMHPRLYFVLLGFFLDFTDKEIVSLVINEEISPISNVLPINTAELLVHSEDFTMFDINSNLIDMVQKSKIGAIINGIIDDVELNLGYFFLDKFEFTNTNDIKISFVSLIKKLYDNTIVPYAGFKSTLEQYVKYILNDEYNYSIPDNLKNIVKTIYFQKGKTKDLFQQLLFLYGLMVNDLNDRFEITKLDKSKIKTTLYPSKVLDGVKIERIDPINIISVDTIDYNDQEDVKAGQWWNAYNFTTIYQDYIPEDGNLYLEFETPANLFRYKIFEIEYIGSENKPDYKLTEITGNRVDEVITSQYNGQTINSVFYSDPGTGTSADNPHTYSLYNKIRGGYTYHYNNTFKINHIESLMPGNLNKYIIRIDVALFIKETGQHTVRKQTSTKDNLLHIEKPEIFNKSNVSEFAQNTLDYYNDINSKIEASYINDNMFQNKTIVRAGDTVYMYIDNNIMVKTTIVKQTIDLSNGFLTKMTGICDSNTRYGHIYMQNNSNEQMYMGNNTLI